MTLEELKAGDKVLYYCNGYTEPRVFTVGRVTRTQIIVPVSPTYSMRFRRDDGFLRGAGPWSIARIEPAPENVREAAEEAAGK